MCVWVCVCLPPDGHSQGLWGAGAGTDNIGSQPFGLKDVEEGVTGGDGPYQMETKLWVTSASNGELLFLRL